VRGRTLAWAGAAIALVALCVVGSSRWSKHENKEARCGEGFYAVGARCCVAEACEREPEVCPAPLVRGPKGCDAPATRVHVPAASLVIGPSDWEAEGRVPARRIETKDFAIDAFEATLGSWADYAGLEVSADRARAKSGVTRDEAESYCASRGGRLPTDDEWIVAASVSVRGSVRRYPWGDTGAVCRRGAWGLAQGPCASTGEGPDTVGAHPEGATDRGIFDMAGNVAEWVARDPDKPDAGVARGGSWRTALATELRTWNMLELDPGSRDDRVGARCAYAP
jgi:formylglycine-generating enzyme required for sulfatase activity